MASEEEKTALLKKQESYIHAAVWKFSRRGLPPSIEVADLFQTGMIATAKFYEENGWKHSATSGAWLAKRVDGSILDEINRAKYGVSKPVDGVPFTTIPFSHLEGGDEESRAFLEMADEQFSFSSAEITPPVEASKRLAIYQTCSSMLANEFKASTSYEKVRGIWFDASWHLRFNILGYDCSISGFDSRKKTAQYKYQLLKHIQDAVLPIELPKASGLVVKLKNQFAKLKAKSASLERVGQAQPSFLYGDPLVAMQILENLCLADSVDWTELRSA